MQENFPQTAPLGSAPTAPGLKHGGLQKYLEQGFARTFSVPFLQSGFTAPTATVFGRSTLHSHTVNQLCLYRRNLLLRWCSNFFWATLYEKIPWPARKYCSCSSVVQFTMADYGGLQKAASIQTTPKLPPTKFQERSAQRPVKFSKPRKGKKKKKKNECWWRRLISTKLPSPTLVLASELQPEMCADIFLTARQDHGYRPRDRMQFL